MAAGPYLSRLPVTFLDRLPGLRLKPLPLEFGTTRFRAGLVCPFLLCGPVQISRPDGYLSGANAEDDSSDFASLSGHRNAHR